MARDVEADVVINDKSDRGLRSAAANLRGYERELDRTTRATDKVTKGSSKLGEAASENARNLSRLNNEVAKSQKELATLAKAFAQAGNSAERMDISKSIRKQQSEIRNLSKNRDLFKDLFPEPQEALSLGQKLSQGISRGVAASGPYVTAALAGAAAAAAPLIGATIAGALTAGVGSASVAGGLVLAAKDARVQAAFKGLGKSIQADLKDAAEPFIGEALQGINRIHDALDTIDFGTIFDSASKFVGPLVDGVGIFIEQLGNGIEDLVQNAGPSIDALADGIALIGQSIGEGLSSLSDNGEDAASALRVVFGVIDNSLDVVFAAVNALTELYGIITNPKVTGFFPKLLDIASGGGLAKSSTDELSSSLGGFVDPAEEAAEAAEKQAEALRKQEEAARAVIEANASLYESITSAAQAQRDANKALEENGRGLDVNTEKGLANREVLSNLASAYRRNYEDLLAVNGANLETQASGDQLRASFIATATQAGATAAEAKALADQILGIPDSHDTDIRVLTGEAKSQAEEIKRIINNIPSYKLSTVEVAIKVTGNTNSSAVQAALNKQNLNFAASFGNYASGNLGTTGGATKAREQGPIYVTTQTILDGAVLDSRTKKIVAAESRKRDWSRERTRY